MCFNYNNCCNGGCYRRCYPGCNYGNHCCRRPVCYQPYRPFCPIVQPFPPTTPTPPAPSAVTLTTVNAAPVAVAAGGIIPLNTISSQTGTALTPIANGVQINQPGTYLINYNVPLTNTSGADANIAVTLNAGTTPISTAQVTGVAAGDTATPTGTAVYTVPANATLPQILTLTNTSTATDGGGAVAVEQPATTAGTTPTLSVTKIA